VGRIVAKVAVSKAVYAIDKPYDYLVPVDLERRVQVGMRVLVPFGSGNRGAEGIVLSISSQPSSGGALKAIHALLDEQPVLDEKGVQLALWMRERYFATLYECVKAMLPAGLYFSLRDCVTLTETDPSGDLPESIRSHKAAMQLLELLRNVGGSADMEQIRMAFGTKDPNPAIRELTQAGLATMDTNSHRGVGDKTEKIAVLDLPPQEAMAIVAPKRKSAPLRYSVVELLCTLGSASVKELCYFTGASPQTVRSLEKSGIVHTEQQEVFRRAPEIVDQPPQLPRLNDEQQQAFVGLLALAGQEKASAALLYGVTGSGKTQIYIRLIHEMIAKGKQALVLVPEIALTPQLLRIFTSQFGKRVALLHSSLRAGERYDEWKRCRNGDADVVLGTRSAVFAPMKHLGLIILDEEQEGSYKSENTPRYHAKDIAKYRSVQNDALLVLGSATPSIETMYQAQEGNIHMFTLRSRYNRQALPQVIITDMKQELRQGNAGAISTTLRDEIAHNLERGEQSILFLNRRGANRMVSCGVCGHVPECPRCSVKLTYHSANRRLMCHHCGFSQPIPDRCPACGGELNFIGVGTQRVQEELEELFPNTQVLRMDADTVTASNSHETMLSRFQKERIPILIGTQMVAKGLDFANVTLVGAIAPDLSLYVDDFRAAERTFSLLTQVVGRAGRGEKQGRAVIQTYTPEHDVIRFSAEQNYDQFYRTEIEMRRLRGDPPFSEIVVITASGMDEGAVLRCAMKLRQSLQFSLEKEGNWKVLGPAPAAVAKVNNRYRYRITLQGRTNRKVRELIAFLLRAAANDKENRGVSVYADLDPYNS